MRIAAMSSGFAAKACSICVERALLGRHGVAHDLGRRPGSAARGSRRAASRTSGSTGLARVGGVGERQRVAGAAVEGLAEVEHLVALLARDALGEVAAHLPVEGRLERVLDAERAARDEERVAAGARASRAARTSRRTRRTRRCRRRSWSGSRCAARCSTSQELRLLHLRVVVADRVRGEEREQSRYSRPLRASCSRRRGSSRSRGRGRSRRPACAARGSCERRLARWVRASKPSCPGLLVACHGRGIGAGKPRLTSSHGRIATRALDSET